MSVLKSPTGNAARNGKSNVANIITANKYHPHIAATKKLPPVAFSNVAAIANPLAADQNVAAAKPKPSVAPVKIRTKTILVRREQIRKIRDRSPMKRA
jgi:hypothetical protein